MPVERPALKEAIEMAPAPRYHAAVSAIESRKSLVMTPPAIQTPATVVTPAATARPAARAARTEERRCEGAGAIAVIAALSSPASPRYARRGLTAICAVNPRHGPVTSRAPAGLAGMTTAMPLPTAARADDFVPIADYGLLSDCSSAALVSRDGSIDWLCLPRFDSPGVFSRLLDPSAGHWSLTPVAPFTSERRYLPGSLVIETTFVTETGSVRLTDALAIAEGQRGHDLGHDAPHEVLRLVEGVEGEVELGFELAPRPEYGLVRPLFRMEGDGGRTFGGPNRITVRAGVPVEVEDATMCAAFTVAGGERVGFSLRWAAPEAREVPEPTAPDRVAKRLEDTVEAWTSWEADHDIYDGPHRELVRLSSRVLKGLTYRPTGAIVAAPTTSLPETVGGERNWDYRYSWIRDASLTLEALYIGSCTDEAEEFVS